MRLLISGLLILCFLFYHWLDSATALAMQPEAPSTSVLQAASPNRLLDPEGPVSTDVPVVSQEASLPIEIRTCSLAMDLFVEPGGQPLGAAEVILDAWEGHPIDADASSQHVVDGHCSFGKLKAGTYAYRVRQPGAPNEWCGQVEVLAGADTPQRIDLSELATAQ